MYQVNYCRLMAWKSCHPPVTLVTLEKGCKRCVYRRSVTLSPLNAKNPCSSHRQVLAAAPIMGRFFEKNEIEIIFLKIMTAKINKMCNFAA